MKIIVCIKQVPNVKEVKWDPETGNLIRTGLPSIINVNDKSAIEAALLLKEKYGGTVTVISMGPPQVEEALRDALGMGADNAFQICAKEFAGADCWATTYTLGCAIRTIGEFDLVLTGVEAMDGNTAQVGPELARNLGVPVLSYVLNVEVQDGKVRVEQKLGDATRVLEAPLPALITMHRDSCVPRVAPMDCVMEACEKDIPIWGPEEINADPNECGIKGSPTRLRKVFTPKHSRGKVEILGGDYNEAVEKLLAKFKEQYII